MVSPALSHSRLTLDHFSYLRAIAQGMPRIDAARRYLGIEHGAEAVTAHRLVVDRVSAVARRRGDRRWRLVGIEIRDHSAAAPSSSPSLEEWADAEGLDGWSHTELQELYAERFGSVKPTRRSVRNARLQTQRLALLRELEAVSADRAAPTDLVGGWLEPRVAAQLSDAGVLSMGDLQRRIARGGRWWRGLMAIGPRKAERLARHVATVFGGSHTPGQPQWPQIVAAQGSSSCAGRPAPGLVPRIGASNDREAVHAWITARSGSPHTVRLYEREAERFMLWCVIERRKAMSSVQAEDCRAYVKFLGDVPDPWVSRNQAGRLDPGWAPFKGSLSRTSRGVAVAALQSLFSWLVQAQYLNGNAWALVSKDLCEGVQSKKSDHPGSRSFTPAAWSAILQQLDAEGSAPSTARIRWICTFVECTGLRAAEVLKATVADLQNGAEGWRLHAHGGSQRSRSVPVPERAMQATRAYFEVRGLRLEDAPSHAPLLASLLDPMAPISYSALNETFTRFVRRAARSLSADEAARAVRGSTHWLRPNATARAPAG